MLRSEYMPAHTQSSTIVLLQILKHAHAVRSLMLSFLLMLALQGLVGYADGVLPHLALN